MASNQPIAKAILTSMLSVALVAVVFISVLWFIDKYLDYRQAIDVLKNEQYSVDEDFLEIQVGKVLDYIDYHEPRTEHLLRENIKSRTYEAHAIAVHLYEQYRDQKSKAEIIEMIRESLRPIMFNKGRGYFFATNLEGNVVLFTDRPELEGQNLLEMQSENGQFVIVDMIDLVVESDEGYYEYLWTKPDTEGSNHRKIAFVKLFEPLDMFIGTGEYYADVESDVQQSVIERIEGISFKQDGYVFAGTYAGLSLSGPAKGKDMLNVVDINGVKIVQELISAARQGGGVIQYVLPNFEGLESAPKLSYASGVEEWDWYVGAGMYVSDIEETIALQRRELFRELGLSLLEVIIVLGLLTTLILGVSLKIRNRLSSNLDAFIRFFKNARKRKVMLNPDQLSYAEFAELAREANVMIKERDTAEFALIESKEKYRDLVETMVEGILQTDMEENIMFANSAAEHIFGVAPGDLIGANLQAFTNEKQYRVVRDETIKRRAGETGRYEIEILQPGCNRRLIQLTVTPQFGTNGKVSGSLGTFHDITEHKQAENEKAILEEQLRQTQKMEAIGTLAGGIAHDFNNLLFVILGYAELARDSIPATNQASDCLNEITTAGNRAAELVKQILTFARRTEKEDAPLDVSPIVKETIKLLRATLPATIEINLQFDTDQTTIIADPTEVHQVVMNLCTNAGQVMMESGGILQVNLNEAVVSETDRQQLTNIMVGSYLVLSVRDTGPGMSPEVQERIFEPFFTTKDTGKGTGLGLAVIHGIIKDLGGAVNVQSEIGHGTTIEAWFPLADDRASPVVAESEEIPRGTERILVIDDEHALVDIIKMMLENLGYSVDAYSNSEQAFQVYLKQPERFALIVTDQTMPNLTGAELAEKVLANNPQQPIILTTGFSHTVSKDKAEVIGIAAFVSKPITQRSLGTTIRQVLDRT